MFVWTKEVYHSIMSVLSLALVQPVQDTTEVKKKII